MAITAEALTARLRREVPEGSLSFVTQMLKDRLTQPDPAKRIENRYKEIPVSIEKFITGPKYLNQPKAVYPKVMEELIEINSGKYIEVIFTGGIGSGKTTAALYTCAYQLYLLSLMRNPHEEYELDPSSEILFIFQNKTETLAKTVEYNRFKELIQDSPYFQEKFKFDPHRVKSRLIFPNRIEVVPVSGQETATIGQNVMGGIIDELNYMDVVSDSKKAVDGEDYDQAVRLYNSIARRRKSRFVNQGKLPGILCLVSSRRYPGQFTDKKEEQMRKEIKKNGASTIYLYDYRVWEVKPEGTFTDGTFHVFIGDNSRQPYVLEDDEEINTADRHLIDTIPVDFRSDFDDDIINALREVAGKSTVSKNPFMSNTAKVAAAFVPRHKSILSRLDVEFETEALEYYKPRFMRPDKMRYVHIDLGLTSDSAGVVCGYVDRFMHVQRSNIVAELMPVVNIDFALRVRPPRYGEINFEKIRTLIYKLAGDGLNIQWISFDSYQSVDSIQQLKQRGYQTGTLSMDTSTLPYEMLRTAIYDGRVSIPPCPRLQGELLGLERDMKKGKIDHPPRGSKDIADSLAGVVYGLTQKIRIWVDAGYSPMDVPRSVIDAANSHKIRPPKGDDQPQRPVRINPA